MTTSRSARVAASSGSCVTRSRTPANSARCCAELAADLAAGARVERGEGFVEQQQARARSRARGRARRAGPGRRRARAACALAWSPSPTRSSQSSARCRRLARGERRGCAARTRRSPSAEVREEEVVLEDHADRAALGHDERAGRGLVERRRRRARCGRASMAQQPGERPQQRGLARAVRAEERDDLAVAGVRASTSRSSVPSCERAACASRLMRPPSQRSRSSTSTTIETASSTRLSAIATLGLATRAAGRPRAASSGCGPGCCRRT